MKKLVSIALALVMILALGTLASADETSATVTLNLGTHDMVWSIPAETSLDLDSSGNFKDEETITVSSWKADVGYAWVITCPETINFSIDGTNSISASVTIDNGTFGWNTNDSSFVVNVDASGDADKYPHLSTDTALTTSLEFKCEYQTVA